MSNVVIANWQYQSSAVSSGWVYPDGCQDVIMRKIGNSQPVWHLTTLDESARIVVSSSREQWIGYRLHPGVSVNQSQLLAILQGQHLSKAKAIAAITDCSTLSSETCEALACLSCNYSTVESVAKRIGVSVRTLQRKLTSTTSKSPSFWLSLARARKAAVALASDCSLTQIALKNGYSDQAHMTREMRRWFSHTPTQLRNDPQPLSLIIESGYPDSIING